MTRKGPAHRINDKIRADVVRVVGHPNESMNGVMPLARAIELARELESDLVEIAENADPPVCRITEYSKFIFEQKKKEKVAKAKQHKVVVKEIRFGPNTDDHDFNFKLKHAYKFLEEGNKVKTYIHFFGRSIVHKDRSKELLDRFAEQLDEVGKIEAAPHMEGKRMYMILAPKK
jgi:translation initiation factor IF-3